MKPKAHFGTTLNGNDAHNFVKRRDELLEKFWNIVLCQAFLKKDVVDNIRKKLSVINRISAAYKPISTYVGNTSRCVNDLNLNKSRDFMNSNID